VARLAITADIGFGAQVGTPDALFELGMLYATGRDVVADLVAAHKWFNIAAARGNVAARTRRVEIAREMSGDEIAEAQRQAREWLQTN
jgi:TPR repeat protein